MSRWKSLSLAGKLPYDGPKTFPAIVRQICKETKMREDFVTDVIYLALGGHCLGGVLRRNEKAVLTNIGRFNIKSSLRKEFRKRDERRKASRFSKYKDVHYRAIYKYAKKVRVMNNYEKYRQSHIDVKLPPPSFRTFLKWKYPDLDLKSLNLTTRYKPVNKKPKSEG
jgi:hypothetical protein